MGVKFGFKLNNSLVVGPDSGGGDVPSELKTEMNEVFNRKFGTSQVYDPDIWADTVNIMAPLPIKTVTGPICSFSDGADGLPVKELIAQVVAVQSGTGDPSPSNVRPISGWANVGVTRTGKNGFNLTAEDFNNGETVGSGKKVVLHLKPSTTYTLSTNEAGGSLYSANIWFNGTSSENNGVFNGRPRTATTDANGDLYILMRTTSISTIFENYWIQLEVGSTATSYEPYTGTTVSIALGQTVFGGELDVTSGVLTVTYAKITLDGTQEINTVNWRPNTTTVGWIYKYTDFQNAYVPYSSVANIISDQLVAKSYNTLYGQDTTGIATYNDSSLGLVVKMDDTSLTTKTAINAYLAQNPIDVVYELAQPVTVQLTPTEIKTLLGTNNVWSDTGDTTVEYYADINAIMSQLEAQNTPNP